MLWDATRPVENTQAATVLVTPPIRNSRSLDGHRRFTQRTRSTSPTAQSRHSERQRERSNSRDRQHRQDLTIARGGESRLRDTIFLRAKKQLVLAGLSAETTQAATFLSVILPNQRPRSLDGRREISQRAALQALLDLHTA
jgi:hypothetical protein